MKRLWMVLLPFLIGGCPDDPDPSPTTMLYANCVPLRSAMPEDMCQTCVTGWASDRCLRVNGATCDPNNSEGLPWITCPDGKLHIKNGDEGDEELEMGWYDDVTFGATWGTWDAPVKVGWAEIVSSVAGELHFIGDQVTTGVGDTWQGEAYLMRDGEVKLTLLLKQANPEGTTLGTIEDSVGHLRIPVVITSRPAVGGPLTADVYVRVLLKGDRVSVQVADHWLVWHGDSYETLWKWIGPITGGQG